MKTKNDGELPLRTAYKKISISNGLVKHDLCIEIAYQKEIVYKVNAVEEQKETPLPDSFAQKVFFELAEFFSGKRKEFTFSVCFQGTEFQCRVWQEIAKIPYGRTISYAELAKRAGNPKACRAAARACHDNPLAFCVPCHRVIAKNGSIGGYGYGTVMKSALLNMERNMEKYNDNG